MGHTQGGGGRSNFYKPEAFALHFSTNDMQEENFGKQLQVQMDGLFGCERMFALFLIKEVAGI